MHKRRRSEVLAYFAEKCPGSPSDHEPMPFNPSSYILFVFRLKKSQEVDPSRHGMVSPHRLSITKDWPEYKNIISFSRGRKRRNQHGSVTKEKKNPSMLQEFLEGKKNSSELIFYQEFKTNQRAEALWKYCMRRRFDFLFSFFSVCVCFPYLEEVV